MRVVAGPAGLDAHLAVLAGLSIFSAFVPSVFVPPSVLVIWDRFFGPDRAETGTGTGTGQGPRPKLGPEPATGTPNPDVDVDSEDD